MTKSKIVAGILIAILFGTAFACSTLLIAYTDRAFICENTGSRKGFREWFTGTKTRTWYRISNLERFMQSSHPEMLNHRWTSYQGDGSSLLPGLQSRGHGRPGPILRIEETVLNPYVSNLTDPQKLELYRLFSGSNMQAIRERVEQISDRAMHEPNQR